MKRLLISLLIIILVIPGLIFGGCAQPAQPAQTTQPTQAPAPAPHQPVNIEILSSPSGSVGYILSLALADLLNKYHPWVRATAKITGGSGENIETLIKEPARRSNSLIWVPSSSAYAAENGIKPYVSAQLTGLQLIFQGFPGVVSFITMDPNIKEYKDLRGKRIGSWPKTIALNVEVDALNKAMGQDFTDSLKIEYLGFPQAQQGVADGVIDAAIASAVIMPPGQLWVPSDWLVENLQNPKSHLIDIPADLIKKAAQLTSVPVAPYNVPAGALKAGHPAITGTVNVIGWVAHESFDSEVGYEIAKFAWEHRADFVVYTATAKSWTADTVGLWPPGEKYMNPGAVKFFKEQKMPVGTPK